MVGEEEGEFVLLLDEDVDELVSLVFEFGCLELLDEEKMALNMADRSMRFRTGRRLKVVDGRYWVAEVPWEEVAYEG